jgi:ABC-type dipeptide/oligopeptide/nickel transport system permease component
MHTRRFFFFLRDPIMLPYLLRRLVVLPLVMCFVTLILFLFFLQLPLEQRVQVYMPPLHSNDTPEKVEHLQQEIIARRGLDRPLPVQYVFWIGGLLSGDWGYSASWREPVLEGLLRRAPASAELALVAMIPSVLLAFVLGNLAARYRNRVPDYSVRAAASVVWGLPSFFLAFVILIVFSIWLRWFSPGRLSVSLTFATLSSGFRTYTGMYTIDGLLNGNLQLVWDALMHLAMPALALALTQWALLTRIMRASLLEELRQDYITTARAKGLSEGKVRSGHARPNAVLPFISLTGISIPLLISDLIVVETIFNFNGLGGAVARSVISLDVPVGLGFALFACCITIAASWTADMLYGFFDPRVRAF